MTPGDMIISILGGILVAGVLWILCWIIIDVYECSKKDDWSDL